VSCCDCSLSVHLCCLLFFLLFALIHYLFVFLKSCFVFSVHACGDQKKTERFISEEASKRITLELYFKTSTSIRRYNRHLLGSLAVDYFGYRRFE